MIRRPPRSTQSRSSAASDVYKRQLEDVLLADAAADAGAADGGEVDTLLGSELADQGGQVAARRCQWARGRCGLFDGSRSLLLRGLLLRGLLRRRALSGRGLLWSRRGGAVLAGVGP